MLTGQIKSYNDLPEGDFRKMLPRFQPDFFENNMKLVKQLEAIAKKKNCTPAQLALNWVVSIAKKPGMPEIIPIPGATTAEHVKENSVEIELTAEELAEIDEILATCEVIGDRYHAVGMKLANG
jgi:pyridoxine 4-dehydrogenase